MKFRFLILIVIGFLLAQEGTAQSLTESCEEYFIALANRDYSGTLKLEAYEAENIKSSNPGFSRVYQYDKVGQVLKVSSLTDSLVSIQNDEALLRIDHSSKLISAFVLDSTYSLFSSPFSIFKDKMVDLHPERIDLENEIHYVVENKQFTVVYRFSKVDGIWLGANMVHNYEKADGSIGHTTTVYTWSEINSRGNIEDVCSIVDFGGLPVTIVDEQYKGYRLHIK